MSLEVIEMMIKESLRDGEISASERETLVKQGESFGISKETVLGLIEEKLNEIKKKKEKEQHDDLKRQELWVNRYESDVYKIFLKAYQDKFKKNAHDIFYNLIKENRGKMPRDKFLKYIEDVPKEWQKTETLKGSHYGVDYEFEVDYKITKDFVVSYINEIENEYKKNQKLTGDDSFLSKIKTIFKK